MRAGDDGARGRSGRRGIREGETRQRLRALPGPRRGRGSGVRRATRFRAHSSSPARWSARASSSPDCRWATASRRSSRPRARRARAFREMFLETPDTNDGKSLASLIRPAGAASCARPRRPRASVDGPARPASACTSSSSAAPRATWEPRGSGASSPWPMGIPRLRMPHGAPSRSTLKLAEALAHFVGEEALAKRMRPGHDGRRPRRLSRRLDLAAGAARPHGHRGRQRPDGRRPPRNAAR